MRIGILGAARIAPHVVIGPASRSGFATIVAVAARDVERARAFADRHVVPYVEQSYDSLLSRDDLDLEAEFIGGVDTCLRGELAFPSGVRARVECSMVAGHRAADLRLRGTAGEIVVENSVAPQLTHRVVVRNARGERTLTFEAPGSFDHQLAHVRDVLAGDAEPLTGGNDAIGNMAAIEALYAAPTAQPRPITRARPEVEPNGARPVGDPGKAAAPCA